MNIDNKLALDLFHVDSERHLKIDPAVCRRCEHKWCTRVCPVENYRLDENGDVVLSWEGCLECGTCRIVCDLGAISWDYPRGGYGITYRF
jgi:ferredoxin like protein